MYEQTDMKAKAVFAKARIFGEPFKVLREDKTLVKYYTKLSSFHSQYRMIRIAHRIIFQVFLPISYFLDTFAVSIFDFSLFVVLKNQQYFSNVTLS